MYPKCTYLLPELELCLSTLSTTLLICFHSMASASNPNLRIIIERNPSQSRLDELNIKSWPKWGCSPGKYQLKFDAEETCYLVKGKVKAYPKGSSDSVEFGAGDLVTIPKGMSCTWDVSVAVDKYYKFESTSSSFSPPSSSS